MNKNQSGFTVIEGLLLLLVVIAIGGVGYYVYNSQKQADRSLNNATSVSDMDSPTKKSDDSIQEKEAGALVDKNPGFVTISEWGIAARIGSTDNADKLTYRIAKDEYGDDTAYFLLTDAVSTKCREIGLALHRKVGGDSSKYTKIGAANYAPSAAPASMCDKQIGEESAIALLNQLTTSINKYDYEFKASN